MLSKLPPRERQIVDILYQQGPLLVSEVCDALPAVSDTVAKKSALSEIVRVFFNGSPANAASALLGMSEKLKEDELDELEQMIARARKAKGGK
jgi:predicted transcriptional regulator